MFGATIDIAELADGRHDYALSQVMNELTPRIPLLRPDSAVAQLVSQRWMQVRRSSASTGLVT